MTSLYDNAAQDAFLVVPSDTVSFTKIPSALYVGGAGNITLVTAKGTTILFTALPVGTILPVSCTRVDATNTTATLIIGLVA